MKRDELFGYLIVIVLVALFILVIGGLLIEKLECDANEGTHWDNWTTSCMNDLVKDEESDEEEYRSPYFDPNSKESYFLYGLVANKAIDEAWPEDLNLSVQELAMYGIYACDGNRSMASKVISQAKERLAVLEHNDNGGSGK